MSDKEDQKNNYHQGNSREKGKENGSWHKTVSLGGMYENWFLDYASYVILERAVPAIYDGLKPVHRRILHAMRELDDGRYNKVANLIGHTMKYHPHGDAAIGDALVALGQKDLLIDTQGNWGNIFTGDSAAAPRYIEARLSEFAKEVVFNPKTTEWTLSYDGRNKEPVALPVKFPLLLAQGVEGIAVGLASKILPHNFNELIDASINVLQGKDFVLYPDFPGGGQVDVSKYNDGVRGSRIRVRSKITKLDRKTLVISEIPFGQTTNSLIDSVLSANEKGKIRIKKIDDNTAEQVEILVHLASGVSPDQTIDALYAFTNCEVSISPNACVIEGDKPRFLGVSDILRHSAHQTQVLLTSELEIRKGELLEKLLMSSLEKIFIENRIYRDIEDAETFEEIIRIIDEGLQPFKKQFYREITRDDIIKLTQIQIKRISKFDSFKADELIKKLNEELKEVEYNLENIVDYTIRFYKHIKSKYGKGRERLSELRDFENIEASMAAVASEKLYLDRDGGFAGTSLRKAEYIADCSDIDDIIFFRADGTCMVTKVDEKVYVGKNIIHIDVFKRNDERTIYNMVYRDGLAGPYFAKRFPVKGITRDKEYDLTQGKEKSKVFYFSANPNGEAEVVNVKLYPRPRLKKTTFDFDFSKLFIRTRSAKGKILTKRAVRYIKKKEEGVSTLGGIDIWLDENVMRLNRDEYGRYLGDFEGDDKIITFYDKRWFTFHGYDLTTHFEENADRIEKYDENRIYTLVYWNGEKNQYFVKRFQPEFSEKPQPYLDDHKDTEMVYLTDEKCPRIELVFDNTKRRKPKENEIIELDKFIDVKSYKAMGNRLSRYEIREVKILDPEPCDEPMLENAEEESTEPEDLQQDTGQHEVEQKHDKNDFDQMKLNLDS